jgi:hypothetical protein
LKERPSVTETFSEHWLFEGFRGFFLNLNVRPFLGPVVRPVLLDVVEADPGAVRNDPQRLLGLAQRVLDGIRANVRALPAVLNTFYREAIDFLEDRFVVYYLFYEMIVASSFANPVLAEAVDFLVPESDWKDFHFVYDVFRAKLGFLTVAGDPFLQPVTELPEFTAFEPAAILADIRAGSAALELPSLQHFCDIVQCAHQPLLLTTHYIAVLFRFVASLQSTGSLPKSIDRVLHTIFQNMIADTLETLPDDLFWFPCFLLTYLKVPPTTFLSASKTSPLYRLLSSPYLRISDDSADLFTALDGAKSYVNVVTHPEIKTELQWLLATNDDMSALISNIGDEIGRKRRELDAKRQRGIQLNAFAKLIEGQFSRPGGPGRSLACAFKNAFQCDGELLLKVKEFCGPAFDVIGPRVLEAALLQGFQARKHWTSNEPSEGAERDSEVEALQGILSKPIICSSFFSTISRLGKDLVLLNEFAGLLGVKDAIRKTYRSPFFGDAKALAFQIARITAAVPEPVLEIAVGREPLEQLKQFVQTFPPRD